MKPFITEKTESKGNHAILRNGYIQNASFMTWFIMPKGKVEIQVGNERTGYFTGYMTMPIEVMESMCRRFLEDLELPSEELEVADSPEVEEYF